MEDQVDTKQESNSQIPNFYMEKNLIYMEHYSVFCIEKEEQKNGKQLLRQK